MLNNSKFRRLSPQVAKWGVLGIIIAILIITVLEFPPPIGFETRPQGDVSQFWLVLFLVILITEIAAIPLIFTRPGLGKEFAIGAAALNIIQVIADQAHLMQPEVAPLEYSLLEFAVVIASLALAYFARNVRQGRKTFSPQ
ncbi:MAG TPA: hypothetical protein VF318_09125 [Dehalococcoidales bacterium]